MPAQSRHPAVVGALFALGLAALSLLTFAVLRRADGNPGTTGAGSTSLPTTTSGTGPTSTGGDTTTFPTTSSSTTSTTTLPLDRWVDRRTVGQPWGTAVSGLLTFRGNPTNTWYGTGPVPATPEAKWRYPEEPMCSQSTDLGVTATWCGNGWTGQPVIWERPDGVTEMMFGGYDRKFHFVDTATGHDTRTPILTGDLVKGSPTLDPDGFPLVYFGSRDNELRIVALDRGEALELWSHVADLSIEGRWNNDWDAAPRIVNDVMFEGCENGIFYIWKLNRAYGTDGLVTVNPVLLFKMQTWTDQLLADIGPAYPAVSVENSAALFEGRLYFANSAGRVLGLDITQVEQGVAPVVFDYWVGDDVDASIVVDAEGMIYVSAEYERYLSRAQELGQLVKLDPYRPDDPYVWGMFSLTEPPAKGGLWSTPALGDGVLYAATNKGYLVVVDQETGEELWAEEIGPGAWSSPVLVEGHLLMATSRGYLQSYDVTDPREPVLEWEYKVGEGAALEATPALWDGTIYLASRDGYLYAIGE